MPVQTPFGGYRSRPCARYESAREAMPPCRDTKLKLRRVSRVAGQQQSIDAEAALDGIYIIRTSLGPEDMAAGECVRN